MLLRPSRKTRRLPCPLYIERIFENTVHLLSQVSSLTLNPRPFIRGYAALMGAEHLCHAAVLSYFISEVIYEKNRCC